VARQSAAELALLAGLGHVLGTFWAAQGQFTGW
jgi:hypothetical protein